MKRLLLLLTFLAAALLSARAQSLPTIKATTRILPDGSTMSTVVNTETRTSEETVSQTNGKVLRKTIYTLNELNFATAAAHYDGQGKMRYKETYAFDGTGRVTESKLFTPDDRPLGRRVFIYDGKDPQQARIQDYDANGVLVSPQTKAGTGRKGEVRKAVPVR